MSSTTSTTKKPNNGPCAACNKEGAVFRCAPCRDAGVDVFFCNRECQVKLWKTHKNVCKKTSNPDLEKEQSSTKKEVKQEGKKEFQLRKYTQICANCSKTDADIGSKLSGCSKCNSAFYCSRECQVEDWPKHKSQCKHNFEFVNYIERYLDLSGKNTRHLLQKWLAKTRTLSYFSEAVYLAVKKEGVEHQPPVKAVRIEIEFDYNAQTFIVTEVPRAVTIADLDQDSKEFIRKTFKERTAEDIDCGYIHFVIISTKELGKMFESKIEIGITKGVLDQMNAAHIDMFQLRYLYAQNHLKSNLFRGWKSIQRKNLRKQIEQMNIGQSYTVFVQNALQFFCKKSLRNTHRIVIYMKVGKEIGQISRLLHYGIVSIAEFEEYKERLEKLVIRVEDTESRPHSCTEMAIETLFVDFDTCFCFDHSVFCGVNATQNKTAKQCKKAADKHFRKLQQSVKEMPSDLLEKVSL
ncbi:hypothetical protein CTEN210_17771 [Chaetoceros tenuissimus]|uniref:MYND-type domain-containing protein n=1 Tax=Chaetoceros tenuissimus TaxID=426638 RepID=A0AAD3HF31_9STRA|nr:hypothetical protein CTEN210_17771 [Chaetoceros tenuissimus]